MSYCTKCGTQLAEGESECKTCGCLQSNDTISLEKSIPEKLISEKLISEKLISEKPISEKPISEKPISEKTISEKTISEKTISEQIQQSEILQNPANDVPNAPANNISPSNTNNLSNGWKVFLTAITLIVPLIGPVIGLIMSLIYLSNPNLDTKSYGKALLILIIAYIGISVVCCLGFMFLSMAGMIADPGYYYNQFDVY